MVKARAYEFYSWVIYKTNETSSELKLRLHPAINRVEFVSWCMLYIRTKVTKCIREKMTLYFRGWTIKSHSPGYEIGLINRSV